MSDIEGGDLVVFYIFNLAFIELEKFLFLIYNIILLNFWYFIDYIWLCLFMNMKEFS